MSKMKMKMEQPHNLFHPSHSYRIVNGDLDLMRLRFAEIPLRNSRRMHFRGSNC